MIPDEVKEAIRAVRRSARTNMYDRKEVLKWINRFGLYEAYDWLYYTDENWTFILRECV